MTDGGRFCFTVLVSMIPVVELRGGSLVALHALYLNDSTMVIRDAGELSCFMGGYSLGDNARIENYGRIYLDALDDQERCLDAAVVNYGFLKLNGTAVGGQIENHGQIDVHGSVSVHGSIRNFGTIIDHSGVLHESEGSITGNPPEMP